MEGHFASSMVHGIPFGANASWRSRDALEIQLRNTQMATGRRFLFRFAGDQLDIIAESTLPEPAGLGDLSLPALTFTLSEGEINTKTRMYWEVNQ